MYQMAKKARNNCLEIRCLGSKLFIALIRRRITVECVISRALFNIKIVACVFFGPLLSIVPISVFDISLLKASADVQFVCLDALLFFFCDTRWLTCRFSSEHCRFDQSIGIIV